MAELVYKQYFWQRWMQVIPASPPGAWAFSRFLHYVDNFLMRISGNKLNVATSLNGLPVVIIKNRGAKSGKLRTTPLIGVPDGEDIVLIASNWGQAHNPAWYYNMTTHPEVEASFSGYEGPYVAREVTDEDEYNKRWEQAAAVYIGYPKYRKRAGDRRIPILVLESAQASA